MAKSVGHNGPPTPTAEVIAKQHNVSRPPRGSDGGYPHFRRPWRSNPNYSRERTHDPYRSRNPRPPYPRTKNRPYESRGREGQRIRTMFFRTRPAGQSTPISERLFWYFLPGGKHYLYAQGVLHRPRPKQRQTCEQDLLIYRPIRRNARSKGDLRITRLIYADI